jgi:gamma-glutamyltranspeptidase/glutathione hydrolase
MVASSQPLATEAGLGTLKRGGTAADAAVAVAAALNVTEPCSTGLGGDFFALYYEAATGEVTALNGSGRAPQALTIERAHADGAADDPFHPHTVTVPGAASGWVALHARHGTLELADVLAPAIMMAREGVPIAESTSFFWSRSAARLLSKQPGGHQLTLDGRGPRPGEVFANPGLARVMETLAEEGHAGFYEGWVAERIIERMQGVGGVMTPDDLAAHSATWDEPISTEYEGLRVWECPPNGQGLIALLALNILTHLELPPEPLSVERLHLIIEALRLAFADGRWYIADPRQTAVPITDLLSMGYAAERAALIDPQRATVDQQRGAPVAGSDTVQFVVVDEAGNAASVVNSNYMGFGTGLVPEGTGFSLQNRGAGFSLEPDHPNALAPGKRPYHTIIPGMATYADDGTLYGPFGVMGGFMQPQGHAQVMLAMRTDGLDPQKALDRPRIAIEGGEAAGRVALEAGIPITVLEGLAERGHDVRPVSRYYHALFGRGQVVTRDRETGVLCAGSDPRADGLALGY